MISKLCSVKSLAVLLFSIASVYFLEPNYAQILSSKSTEAPNQDKNEKPYSYEPIDIDFWDKVENYLERQKYQDLLADSLGVVEEFGEESDEGLEGLLATAIALKELKLPYSATIILKKVILRRINTSLSQKALYELSLITQNHYYDTQEVSENLLNSNDFGTLHPEIQSFVSFHVGMNDLINGYRTWAQNELKKIKFNSYWDQKIFYQKALNEVSQGKLDEAESRFNKLVLEPTTHEKIKQRAQIQVARISFEKKNYKKASDIYKQLKTIHIREKGRILTERAWALYYQREYSEALGLLTALNAPIFEPSSTPERFILEMIIYKQLCYYETVSEVAKKYYQFYGPAIKAIQKRANLVQVPQVARLALLNMQNQELANFVNQLRDEVELMIELDISKFKYLKEFPKLIRDKEKEIQTRLEFKIEKFFPIINDEILDSEQQVKFLDYTSKIDALRIVRKGEERTYESERINFVQFNKIFWPVDTEFWEDEFDDFKVLIKSKCDQSLPSSSEDTDIIKQFGKEFQ